MGRILEVIFRQPVQLLALIVLLPVMGLTIAYFQPRSYQTTATLWALRTYGASISATAVATDPSATPAGTQATTLSELLQTRVVALLVANETDLASTLDPSQQADPQLRDDALFTEISKNVQVAALGYNLFTITYANHNPEVAQQVVQAVIQVYAAQSQGFTALESQSLLASYQTRLAKAKQDAAAAEAAASQYLAAHPGLANEVSHATPGYIQSLDPQYALLYSQTQNAQATVLDIETHIATISQDIAAQETDSTSLFKIVDAPIVANRPASRLKLLLLAGGTGLGAALVACGLYIIILARRDRAVYTPLDLQKVTAFPVIMELPYLTPATVSQLITSVYLPSGYAR